MKKSISMLLVLVMMASILAGCGSSEPAETTEAVAAPASALEVLENIWALYSEDEKFHVVGGDMEHIVDGAPGSYALTDTEGLAYYFLLSESQIANVDDAASLLHGMMLNNFTCGVFRVKADAEGFAAELHDALANNQWLCSIPDKMVIAVIGGEYVLMSFGIQDAMDPFESKLLTAYPDAEVKYSESLA